MKAVMPLVSVIMPAYNASKYIEQAIESVLGQTMEDLELVIIDDCSTDNTYEKAKRYEEKDNRVLVLRNQKNSGVARTRNVGFEKSRGEYIALLDSDDVWHPQKIEKQIEIVKEKKADIVYCSYALVGEDGKSIHKDFIVPEETDFSQMLKENVIGCSTVLLSCEIAKKYKFTTEFYHEDYVLWMELLKDGFCAFGTKEVLVDYRVLEKSRSANKFNSALKRWDIYRNCLKLPLGKSVGCFLHYFYAGVRKHF